MMIIALGMLAILAGCGDPNYVDQEKTVVYPVAPGGAE